MNFERNIEAKKSLKIGVNQVFQERKFKDDFEAWDYIKSVLKIIHQFGDGSYLIGKIENYVINYVRILNDGYAGPDWKKMQLADPSLMGIIIPEIQADPDKFRKIIK